MTLNELYWSFQPGGIHAAKDRHLSAKKCTEQALKAASEIRKIRLELEEQLREIDNGSKS